MKASIYILTIPLLTAAVTITSCTAEKKVLGPEDGNILKITASAPYTKSPVNLGSDMLYAYPFALDENLAGLNGVPITASSIIGNEYTFYMPQASQDVVFTNITDGNGGYSLTAPADGDTLMTITVADGTPGSTIDLVTGNLTKSDVDPESPTIPQISLKRRVAQISLTFRVKKKDSDELIADLSEFFSEVSVSVPTMSTFCIPSIGDTVGTYYGEVTNRWSCSDIPAAQSVALTQEMFVFPSAPGANAIFTLTLVSTSGNIQTLQSSLDSAIEPNMHYNLTLTLRQKSDGLGFVVDSFIQEEMVIDLDYTDIVVEPSMMSLDISTKASISDTTYKDFTLGTDTVWVYPFIKGDDGISTLAEGYPQAQKAIISGRYTYSVPEGTQTMMFSNLNMCKPESDYWATSVEGEFEYSNLTTDNLYISINKDYNGIAVRPLILGLSEELTLDEAGATLSIDLQRRSTGLRFLLEITGAEDQVYSPDQFIRYFWISVCNEVYNAYLPFSGEYYNWLNPGISEFGPISTSGLTSINYDGRTLWELTPDYLHVIRADGDSMVLDLFSLTNTGGTEKEIACNFDALQNQLNTIVITVNAKELF